MIQLPGLDLQSFLKFAHDIQDTQSNFNLQKELPKSPHRAESLKYLMDSCQRSPEFMQLFKDRYMKPIPTKEEFLAMPGESLGHHVGTYLQTHGINIDFAGVDTAVFYQKEMTLPVYLGIRVLRNHDVLHVLLKKDVSPLSEYFLYGFQIAQFQSPFHVVSLSAGFLGSVLCQVENPVTIFENICEGFALGRRAKFIFGFPLEDHWSTDISEVRKALDLPV